MGNVPILARGMDIICYYIWSDIFGNYGVSCLRCYDKGRENNVQVRTMMTDKSTQLKEIILILETQDGKCYQAILNERQNSAIRSVLAALPDKITVLDSPLGNMYIERPKDKKK